MNPEYINGPRHKTLLTNILLVGLLAAIYFLFPVGPAVREMFKPGETEAYTHARRLIQEGKIVSIWMFYNEGAWRYEARTIEEGNPRRGILVETIHPDAPTEVDF